MASTTSPFCSSREKMPLLSHGLRDQTHLRVTVAESRLPRRWVRVVKMGRVLYLLGAMRSEKCQKMLRNLRGSFDRYEVS